jgi:hypothetical protein
MTYKNSVEKSELLLDLFYLRYENDDSFRSVKNDEDDQLMKIDQSMKENYSLQDKNSESENSDSENSKNSNQEENLIEIVLSAESFTEVQSVRRNLISLSTDSSQSVRIDQAASLHAAEKTLVVSANQDNDDDHFVLTNDSNSKSNDQIDDQTNNRFIFDENNSLILNYSRSKIKHDYKQLHHRDFVKAAKQIESIESIVDDDLVTSKIFEQIINVFGRYLTHGHYFTSPQTLLFHLVVVSDGDSNNVIHLLCYVSRS